jgi:hypothetical protein
VWSHGLISAIDAGVSEGRRSFTGRGVSNSVPERLIPRIVFDYHSIPRPPPRILGNILYFFISVAKPTPRVIEEEEGFMASCDDASLFLDRTSTTFAFVSIAGLR